MNLYTISKKEKKNMNLYTIPHIVPETEVIYYDPKEYFAERSEN